MGGSQGKQEVKSNKQLKNYMTKDIKTEAAFTGKDAALMAYAE